MIETRITRPRLPAFDIVRENLLERLDGLKRVPLTLICAPAGYGKTTAINQWLENRRVPHAWVSLDAGDNSAPLFWQLVCDALMRPLPRVADALMPAFMGLTPFDGAAFVEGLLQALNEHARRWSCPEHFVLVLDDFHEIDAPGILAGVRRLLDYLPAFFHLAITARVPPSLALARAQVKNRLLQVRTAELRFSLDDATTLLRQRLDENLPSDRVEALYQQTEGWPAALQLAVLQLDAGADHSGSWLGARDPLLSDYLTDEIFFGQGPQVSDFLFAIAPYRCFSADFCEQVLGLETAGVMIERLVERNLLIHRIAHQTHNLYVLHELFRDWLLAHPACPVPAAGQLVGAAHWYADHGLLLECMGLLQHYQLWPALVDLLPQLMLPMLQQGGFAKASQLLRQIPEALLITSPWARYCRAFDLFSRGDTHECDTHLAAVAALLDQCPDQPHPVVPARQALLRAGSLLFRAQLARLRGDLVAAAEFSAGIDTSVLQQEPHLLAWALQEQGAAQFMAGAFAAAQPLLVRGLALSRVSGDRLCHLALLSWLVPALLGQAKPELAQRFLDEARQRWPDDWPGHPGAGVGYFLQAQIDREQGRLDQAWTALRHAFKLQEPRLNPFHGVYFNFYRWWLALSRGDIAEAQQAVLALDGLALNYGGGWPFAVPEPGVLGALTEALKGGVPMRLITWVASYDPAQAKGAPVRRLAETLIWLRARVLGGQPCAKALDAWLAEVTALGHCVQQVQGWLLHALLRLRSGDKVGALDALAQAFAGVDPRHMPQCYLDEMPHLEPVCRAALHRPELAIHARHLLTLALGDGDADMPATPVSVPAAIEPLSPREQEILVWLATGRKNAEIAADLGISVTTVKTHLQKIYAKLGAKDRQGALHIARQQGLL